MEKLHLKNIKKQMNMFRRITFIKAFILYINMANKKSKSVEVLASKKIEKISFLVISFIKKLSKILKE